MARGSRALHHAELAALLPAPLEEQQPLCCISGSATQGSISAGAGEGGQCQQGQGGCPIQLEGWHSLGVLGVRQSQQDLKACFALEI